MPFNSPFKLGPFTVDPEGRLLPSSKALQSIFLRFSLQWVP